MTDDRAERERHRRHKTFLEAVEFGDTAGVEKDITEGAVDLNYTEQVTGLTALHIAAARNAVAVLRLLVKSGRCDFGIKDAQGRTAANVAVTVGRNPAIGRYLSDLQYGAGVATAQSRRATPQADQGEL